MSKFLSNAAVTEFDSEVKHEYQGMQTLRQCVSLRTGVVGEAYKFTRMGKGIANQKATQAKVTPMNIDHQRQTANMENWNAPEYTDIFDQAEVNFDERTELAKTIAGALGRREDQVIIDAMSGITYATTNDQNPDTGRSIVLPGNFSLDAFRQASEHLNDIEAETTNRFCAIRSTALQKLLEDTTVTSSDFNTIKALVNGELDTYVGFKIKLIGTRAEGGLPGAATARDVFFWHQMSMGLAVGIDMQTRIDWVAENTSWLANGMLKLGSVAREPQGVVKVTYNETA